MSIETAQVLIEVTVPQPSILPPQSNNIRLISTAISSHLLKTTVEIQANLANVLLDQTVELFKQNNFDGFEQAKVPDEYIQETYKNEIHSKIKNYFFHHIVIDFLMTEVFNNKIILVNYPRLNAVEMLPDKRLHYHFDLSIVDPIEMKEWKHFAFRSPKRKKYKDLDKQVIAFIENRQNQTKKIQANVIEENDWICFSAQMLNKENDQLSSNLCGLFWLHISPYEVPEPFIKQVLGRKLDESLLTTYLTTNDHDFKHEGASYNFLITIKSIVKGGHFSIDIFKTTFKLKNKADVHNKLMEVFSFRNDISQRRSIIEEVFYLLLSKHRFEVPKHLVLRREEEIVESLSHQSDYHVYKAQKDFSEYVEALAEKQLKEEIIIDQIAYNESLKVDIKDIAQYLHLLCNKRLKEFIYFKPLLARIEGTGCPINNNILTRAIQREKTLNYIIHSLTK